MSEPVGYVYFISSGEAIKIGHSAGVEGRLATLQTSHHRKLEIITFIPGSKADEADLHRRFSSLRMEGEWFRVAPDLLDFIDEVRAARDLLKRDRFPGGTLLSVLADIRFANEAKALVTSAIKVRPDLRFLTAVLNAISGLVAQPTDRDRKRGVVHSLAGMVAVMERLPPPP